MALFIHLTLHSYAVQKASIRALSTSSVKSMYKPNGQIFSYQQMGINITKNSWISKHFISKSDVWLTVHHNSVWIRKTN